jgi:hypothetical protein
MGGGLSAQVNAKHANILLWIWGRLLGSFVRGGLWADHVAVGGVHIRFCGNGGLGFRPYGDSLFLQAGTCQGTCRLAPTVVSPLRP